MIGNHGGRATVEDCQEWAELFGITSPILADEFQAVWNLYDDTGFTPLTLIMDRNMIIRYKEVGYDNSVDQRFRALIESLL